MKKTIRNVVILALLSVVAASCQKEPSEVFPSSTITAGPSLGIAYTLDGMTHYATFASDKTWLDFLGQMFRWAQEGRSVSFSKTERAVGTKNNREIETYTTRSEKDANEWADKKTKEGYKVYISFDSDTGTFTCVAVR
ncbi:MAG: hypothetical protein IJ524_06515 [Bacteroidales bacterium]|nr:hypothetical protein [Bacteroidales bacterium]